MKNILLLLCIPFAFISCSTDSKMKSEIKGFIEKNAKDPKSYEFMELIISDTLTVAEFAKNVIDYNNSNLSFYDSILKNFDIDSSKVVLDFLGDNTNTPEKHEEARLDAKKSIEEATTDNALISKFLTSKDVLIYSGVHTYRNKNGFGALDISSMYVYFDKEHKLLEMNEAELYPVDINRIARTILKIQK
jgi:hypothetical protein